LSEPAFIGVDWGTSSFRAYLADADGRALETLAEGEGALALDALISCH
jgi:2-dehydro-3-deoxygalactonokinase